MIPTSKKKKETIHFSIMRSFSTIIMQIPALKPSIQWVYKFSLNKFYLLEENLEEFNIRASIYKNDFDFDVEYDSFDGMILRHKLKLFEYEKKSL